MNDIHLLGFDNQFDDDNYLDGGYIYSYYDSLMYTFDFDVYKYMLIKVAHTGKTSPEDVKRSDWNERMKHNVYTDVSRFIKQTRPPAIRLFAKYPTKYNMFLMLYAGKKMVPIIMRMCLFLTDKGEKITRKKLITEIRNRYRCGDGLHDMILMTRPIFKKLGITNSAFSFDKHAVKLTTKEKEIALQFMDLLGIDKEELSITVEGGF